MPQHLIKRKGKWFVRIAVPRPLWDVVGRREYQRTTGTGDLREAERRKHEIIASIRREIDELSRPDLNPKDPAWLHRNAHALRRAVQRGELDADLAHYLISDLQDAHLRALKLNGDPAAVPEDIVSRVARASRLVNEPRYSPLSELIADFLEDRRPNVIASTLERMERSLRAFADWLQDDPAIDEITRAQCGEYVSEVLATNGKAPKTNQQDLSYLHAFWQWAIRKGRCAHANPWSGLGADLKGSRRGKAQDNGERRPWTLEEIAKLSKLPKDDPMHPMCMIALYSGMRRDEIANLKLEDVNLEVGMFVVTEGKTRNSVRQLPIHPAIQELVKTWHDRSTDGYLISGLRAGGRDKRRGHMIGKRIGRWIREHVSKDKGVVFHSLRNTFTHHLELAGVPESTAKLLTGHARQSLTYGLYSPGVNFELLREAVLKVNFARIG